MSSPTIRPESYGPGGKNLGTVPEFFKPDMLGKLEHGGNTSVVDGLSAISEFVFD